MAALGLKESLYSKISTSISSKSNSSQKQVVTTTVGGYYVNKSKLESAGLVHAKSVDRSQSVTTFYL